MTPLQILPSTTSHKQEALEPTLDVFAQLGFRDLDLNLNHIIERGASAGAVQHRLTANGQRVWIASGGWCDFFDQAAAIDETFASVDRQADLARRFGADRLRLFFGRLPIAECTPAAIDRAAAHIRVVADRHRDLLLMFENHDGASSRPDICGAILDRADRPNARLTFDPINFEHRGVETMTALETLRPLIAHVHLKGYAGGEFCGFGEGAVDLRPALQSLVTSAYRGAFTVEYEGAGDRTLRLYQSVLRARSALADLAATIR